MSQFENPDPFAADRDTNGHPHDHRDSGHDALPPPAGGSSSPIALVSRVSETDPGTATLSQRTDSEGKKDAESDLDDQDKPKDDTMLEKIKTAADDVQAGVVDKLKSARHRLHLDSIHASGVSKYLNPTNIRMHVRYGSDSDSQVVTRELLWRARDNRKGRNSIAVPRLADGEMLDASFLPMQYTPRMSVKIRDIFRNLWKMFTTFAYWDMAFWSGMTYTIGSALFVADGVIAFGRVAFGEHFESEKAETYGGPLCFFIGALFYQVGAVAAYLEAVNDGSFHGAGMRRLLEGHDDEDKKLLDEKIHHFFSHINPAHRHREEQYAVNLGGTKVDVEAGWKTKEARNLRPGSIYPTGKHPGPRRDAVDLGGDESDQTVYMTWRWWPTWHALRTHHVYEIGWLACTIQLFGVTCYGITAIIVLPGVLSSLTWAEELGLYWGLQIVAALCFLIASLMFMLETQEKWWRPEPGVLGWWVGFWATLGSVGFELIAIFGILDHYGRSWGSYQSDLATIWGSGAYFLCSFLQWYEALNKNPYQELFEPGEMKSHQIHPI